MRVTRSTVPYYFWAATVSAIALVGFAWTVLQPHGTFAERAWGLPFTLPIVLAVFVVPQASFRLQRDAHEPRMAGATRRATVFWTAGFGSSLIVLVVAFLSRQPAYAALMQLLPVCYYVALLGHFGLVREFG